MSHYPSSKYGAGSYYSRSRDSERGRERREWRRSERERSRSKSRDRDREKERQRSPSRESRWDRDRDRERVERDPRRQDKYEEPGFRFGGKGRFGKHSRFVERSPPPPPPVPSTSAPGFPGVQPGSGGLIREKDLPGYNSAAAASSHYGSFHYNANPRYQFQNPMQIRKPEMKSRAKDPKDDPLFRQAMDAIIMNIKTNGDYDQIRKDCFSDIDTKAAFINLHSRIKTTADKYLNLQVYKKDMDKIKTRENMRKKIVDTPYFEKGLESLVSQILTPKIASLIRPKIEDEVYKYLNIKKEGSQPSSQANVVKEEPETKVQHVLSTKEISFHDITPTIRERTAKIVPPPKKESSGAEDSSISYDENSRKEKDEDSQSEQNSDSEEEVMTPLYSPAGKTPIPEDEVSSLQSESRGSGFLQIDESVEKAKSTEEVEESSEVTGDEEQGAKTPTLPDGSISPIVPVNGRFSANIPSSSLPNITPSYLNSSYMHSGLPNFAQSHAQHPPPPPTPPTEHVLPPLPTSPAPPPPPLPSPPRTYIPPPPPICDETACSSPPPPDNQRSFPLEEIPPPPPPPPEENDSEEEPLPPGEEPEEYFTQMKQKTTIPPQPPLPEEPMNYMEPMPPPPPLIHVSELVQPIKDSIPEPPEPEDDKMDIMEEDDEEIEEDSDEESPMFEKIGEVSPPRPVDLQNCELVQELSKELCKPIPDNDNHMEVDVPSCSDSNKVEGNSPPAELPLFSDEECKYLDITIPNYEEKILFYKKIRERDVPEKS